MTQCEKSLQHMQQHGSITPAEAVDKFHCYRLGARIFDLKKRGTPIKTEIVSGKTKDGAPYSFAKYSLLKEYENGN